jgi:hypothetical protein
MFPLLFILIAQNIDKKITTIIQTCVVVDLWGDMVV